MADGNGFGLPGDMEDMGFTVFTGDMALLPRPTGDLMLEDKTSFSLSDDVLLPILPSRPFRRFEGVLGVAGVLPPLDGVRLAVPGVLCPSER